ncbi:MAG: alpha/beta hydrolase family esterase, partial [Alphaproteobacteria bacterium]
MLRLGLACLMLLACRAAWAQADCGGADAPCTVDGGAYFVALPEQPAGAPAVVYLYGYGGSGVRTMGNAGFLAPFTGRGYAVLVPEALPMRPGEPRAWSFRVGDYASPRDDVAFIRAAIDDAAGRFGLDRGRVLVAGFSIGGSMTWDIACLAPDTAAAYAPVAGGFWDPLPDACA